MYNEKTCIICYDEFGIIQLCKKCKYVYCDKCANKINYDCSICYRDIIKKLSRSEFILSYTLDNEFFDNDILLNNIGTNENIYIFIYIHYYLKIFNNCIVFLCLTSVLIYFLYKI